MGLKDFYRKDKEESPSAQSPSPTYSASDKDTMDEEMGHNTNIQMGWTGDGHAGANEYPSASEDYRTLGRWRAMVILITIEVSTRSFAKKKKIRSILTNTSRSELVF